MSTLKLFVLIVGTDVPFPVSIDRSETVGDLKDVILKKKQNALHGIDADQLTLWKPSGDFKLPTSPPVTLKSSLKELVLDRQKGTEDYNRMVLLDPSSTVGDEFSGFVPMREVNVLVEIPYDAGECLEPRTRLKRLIECFIHCFILNFPGWSLPHLHLHIHEPPLILSHTFVHFLILAHRSLKLAFTFPAHTPFHDRQTCLLHPNPTYLSPRSPHPSRITLTVGS
jgi:hypothetical protein